MHLPGLPRDPEPLMMDHVAGTITAPQAAPAIPRVSVSHLPELGRFLAGAQ
jgi:hypothetical protein